MATAAPRLLRLLWLLWLLWLLCNDLIHPTAAQSDSGQSAERSSPDGHRLRLPVTTRTVGDVAAGAESEPGLTWVTAATDPATPDDAAAARSPAGQLERVLERLATIEGLQVQTLRRIEGLDYRLTRVEVQVQERGETIRNAGAEASRRLQAVEAEMGRVETLLDVVRDETTRIRAAQNEVKALVLAAAPHPSARGGVAVAKENEPPAPRLHALAAGVNSLRSMTSGMRDEMSALAANVSLVANLTRAMERRVQLELVSRQDLQRSLAATLSPDSQPARAVPLAACARHSPPEPPTYPRDCQELRASGVLRSGVHQIRPLSSSAPFFVQCDMETDGGGWTLLQSRADGSVSFLRDWNDYKNGFGNVAAEFWLGLEKTHMLTQQAVYELRVELTDFDLHAAVAHYAAFAVGTEAEGYDLRLLGAYDGDAGDSLAYHVAMKFSTVDVDNDLWPEGSCARSHAGGWWYRSCDTSNLNGRYLNGHLPAEFEYQGMYWYDYRGPLYSLMKSRVMIRPTGAPAALPARGPAATTATTETTATTATRAKAPAKGGGHKKKHKKDDDDDQ